MHLHCHRAPSLIKGVVLIVPGLYYLWRVFADVWLAFHVDTISFVGLAAVSAACAAILGAAMMLIGGWYIWSACLPESITLSAGGLLRTLAGTKSDFYQWAEVGEPELERTPWSWNLILPVFKGDAKGSLRLNYTDYGLSYEEFSRSIELARMGRINPGSMNAVNPLRALAVPLMVIILIVTSLAWKIFIA